MSAPADSSESRKTGSSWSFPLLKISGIPIRVHFTFVLFLVWIALSRGGGTSGVYWVAFVIAIFVCVLLHELGHALVAKRFGVMTQDITLYPIGGVAMLDGRPRPRQELWIALAGPAVNLVIALALLPIVVTKRVDIANVAELHTPGAFLSALCAANITLAIFNLIPAFPMDGGRVLRAALALNMPERRATQLAAGFGQFLAICFGFVAVLTGNLIFFIIAAFVFLGAGQEYSMTVTRSFLEGHQVAEAMVVHFATIESGAPLATAAEMLLGGTQHDFPVVVGEEIVGILSRNDIARGLATDGPTGFVAGFMQREFKITSPEAPLEAAYDLFARSDNSPVAVMSDEKLVGLLTQENLSEFIMLAHATSQGRGR
jgi:Zn-dependent protease/CBS domain-containing protein